MRVVDVPLPGPLSLWARVAAMKAVYLLWDEDPADPFSDESGPGVLTGGRMMFDPQDGDWFELVRYANDRALMLGASRFDEFVISDLPYCLDLLAHAPAWAPIAELSPRVLAHDVTIFHWEERGHHHRSPTVTDTQWNGLFEGFTSAENFVNALWEYGNQLNAADCESTQAPWNEAESDESGPEHVDEHWINLDWNTVEPAPQYGDEYEPLGELFEQAEVYEVTVEVLERVAAIKGRSDTTVAARWLAACGVLCGSVTPHEPEPEPFSGVRKRRRLTEKQHGAQVLDWLLASPEIPRTPAPISPTLDKVIDAVKAAYPGRNNFIFKARMTERSMSLSDDSAEDFLPDLSPADANDSWQDGPPQHVMAQADIFTVLRQLWEQERHPEHGTWMFFKMTMADGHIDIERVYDHWPPWFSVEELTAVSQRHELIREFASRTTQWRPSWYDQVQDDYALETTNTTEA
ncbi:Uncharacterised protein [Mycolicibacterium phlei]|nr:hypothetical protein GR01_12500 [Mycobacteroides chelonae]ANB00999.1 hypothetical protein BB28_24525 [Mycobacteroides chelonae CCUG 47445]OLT81602.1 hypothetical protein BKG56_05255 [Mycobacteroides chelonae]ORV17643.1 hypothetical protein AWB96_05545 [Mycobacteroides chelonae]VEG20682.1 Uncharacterised protein [Mycolicibacterium phlei]